MSLNGPCHSCGHVHRTMATVWRSDRGTAYYCHESDHSCYTDRHSAYEREELL